MTKSIFSLLLIFSMISTSDAQSTTNLPIQKVVLYSSGVGYFEHDGHINGSATTELRFRAAQMNDVLKSLLLQDLDGGVIKTVVYPSQDPIDKILGSFDIDLSHNPTLGNVLTQMRGSVVTIRTGNDVHKGTILGVEQVQRQADGATITTDAVNLIEGANIKTLLLSRVDAISLEDAALQAEFTKALQAVAQARDQDKKPLLISHEGNGRRRVRVGYVVESPVWKTSYRLVLPEAGGQKGYLQGWSIVENQTENDWEDIELTLISGRPISFIQDLYNPLYVQRPVVQFELQENLAPQMYERGVNLPAPAEASKAMDLEEADGLGNTWQQGAPAGMASSPRRSRVQLLNSVQSSASAGEVGELFQYVVGHVSLPRQRSAMIPIVTEEIEMERVSIFNQSVQPKHPLHGVHIENSTAVHLMQGPATVLDEGSYAGDARLNELPASAKQLLSYALDFETQVDVDQKNSNTRVQMARIVNGILETQSKRTSTWTYTIKNESTKPRTLIVEHPRRQQWELKDTDDPMESTASLHRFKVPVDADAQKSFTISEEQVLNQSVRLTNLDVNTMAAQVSAGEMSPQVRRALNEAIALKRKVNESAVQIQNKERQINEITAEQARIRENMASVERNSSYYKRLLSKLESQEDDIEQLQKDIQDHRQLQQEQQRDLQNFLQNLNIN